MGTSSICYRLGRRNGLVWKLAWDDQVLGVMYTVFRSSSLLRRVMRFDHLSYMLYIQLSFLQKVSTDKRLGWLVRSV